MSTVLVLRMRLARVCFGLGLLACSKLFVGPGVAATISSVDVGEPGKQLTAVIVSGEIALGDERTFANIAVATDAPAIVVFDSPGGNLYAGMEIGRAIHLKGFFTAVPSGFHCASACALAWLAGNARLMGVGAAVGFHAAYKIGEDTPDASANALVGAYLNQLGLSEVAIVYVTEALPADIHWLTFQEAEAVGISVRAVSDDTEPEVAPAVNAAANDQQWIQIFSRSSQEPAIAFASQYGGSQSEGASVYLYTNGWYGVVLGPYPSGMAAIRRADLLREGLIPSDSFVTLGEKFVSRVWTADAGLKRAEPDWQHKAALAALTYFDASSLPPREALLFMRDAYPEELLYFGRWVSRNEALTDKAKFVQRWPERRYQVDTTSLKTICGTGRRCTVTGIVDWWAYNPSENLTSVGSAEFALVFSSFDPIVVVSDESTVTRRRRVSGRVAAAFARN